MSGRSGYSDCLDDSVLAMYRGQVASAIRGRRGQVFMHDLVRSLDAMERKALVEDDLVRPVGNVRWRACGLNSPV